MEKDILAKVLELVKEASALMKTDHLEIRDKGDVTNIVTSSDIAVQDYLVKGLSSILEGSHFYCEEEDLKETRGEYIWIIDPIDGTANFSRGIDHCCISVALSHYGELELGVVCSPWRSETYYAQKGKGAFLDGKPIKVSDRPMEAGLFCTAMSTYNKQWAKACSDIIYDIYMRCNDTRRFGSAALELCFMARGMVELYFEMRLQPWDYAAASLILREAGGFIAGWDSLEPSLSRQSLVVAANSRKTLDALLEAVHRHMDRLPY